jgi:polyphosphate kinase 2
MTANKIGAITRFYESNAPDDVRDAIENAGSGDILSDTYPHEMPLAGKTYDQAIRLLHIETVKMQRWVKETRLRVAILFEGRDAAGKGGVIQRFRKHLNARGARVVALTAPSETERSQWYFQRYIEQLPAGGEITFFDRSWYNRGVVEHVFDFCTQDERERFFRQVLPFEQALVEDGLHLFKIWLNVGRAEQLRRFLARESDPLKQWKLSPIDVAGLDKWDAYTEAIAETLTRSHSAVAPWVVIRADDKRRARLAAMQSVLSALEYGDKDHDALGEIDAAICGGPDIWDG